MNNIPRLNVVVLISGEGTNLQALIDAERAGKINTRIQAVFSDRLEAPGIKRANRADIPTHCLARSDFPNRATYELELVSHIDSYKPGLIVLAGFMKVLGADFINHFCGQIINIHPSLLPRYRGLDTHQRVLEAGDEKHGATVHFVTEELDGGPRIIQYRISIKAKENKAELAQRVHEGEYIILPQAVAWLATQRLTLEGNNIILDDQKLEGPILIEGKHEHSS